MGNEISSLKANDILITNAASNLANINTRDYKSIRTTIIGGRDGKVSVTTERSKESGIPLENGHETLNVDIPRDIVDMMRAKTGYESALKAIKAIDETLKSVMDILMPDPGG